MDEISFRRLYALMAGTALMGYSAPLYAQGMPPQAVDEGADVSSLEEIVVTAQRRAENLQDVPISVISIGASAAQRFGITDTDALGAVVPSLDFGRQLGIGGVPYIRGVGTQQATVGTESPVAVYVDDVYIGSPSSSLFSFSNIESIEVLKGPQGTLFGRNATGGVVHVRTKRPSHDPSMDLRVGYGSYNTISGSLYGTIGVGDNLAVNFGAAGKRQHDGYGQNLTTGKDILLGWDYGFRSSILYEPSERTTLLISADYNKSEADTGMSMEVVPGSMSVAGAVHAGRYKTTGSPDDFASLTQWGTSLQLQHETGWADLVSISAFRRSKVYYGFDQEISPVPLVRAVGNGDTKSYSQEVRLQSTRGTSFDWIVGAYYFRANAAWQPFRVEGISQGANIHVDLDANQIINSYAAFGEIKYNFVKETSLTLGLRYTHDDYKLNVLRTNAAGTILPGGAFSKKDSFGELTYRAVLDHHFTPDAMAFVSYSRGFKSGGFNVTAPGVAPGAPSVSPEILDAFELGLKTELFDRRLRLNGSAFYYDYSNMQVSVIQVGSATTVNAGAAKIKGVELDLTAAITDRLTLGGGLAAVDGKYKVFPNGPIWVPNPATCTPSPQMLPGARTGGNLLCAGDLAGNRTVRTPKFTGNINATYTLPTSVGEFVLSAALYHNSGFFWEADNRLRQPKYNTLASSLTWLSSSRRWEIQVWGKNLLDEYYFTMMAETPLRDGRSAAAPRTVGVTLAAHF